MNANQGMIAWWMLAAFGNSHNHHIIYPQILYSNARQMHYKVKKTDIVKSTIEYHTLQAGSLHALDAI